MIQIGGRKARIRIPVPKPGRPQSSKKGERGYNRAESRRLERAAKEETYV